MIITVGHWLISAQNLRWHEMYGHLADQKIL